MVSERCPALPGEPCEPSTEARFTDAGFRVDRGSCVRCGMDCLDEKELRALPVTHKGVAAFRASVERMTLAQAQELLYIDEETFGHGHAVLVYRLGSSHFWALDVGEGKLATTIDRDDVIGARESVEEELYAWALAEAEE